METLVMENLPAYLAPPQNVGHIYGVLKYEQHTDSWVIEGEPAVVQMAKKLFPGSDGKGKGKARFKATKRTNGELNWLMQRYPLRIIDEEKWRKDYQKAVDHVIKRNQILKQPQKLEPSPLVFNGHLTEFQKEGLAFLVHNAPALLADDMGLGKTVQALAWIAKLDMFPGLIVAPSSVLTQWMAQINRFIHHARAMGQQSLFPQENDKGMVHIIKGLKPYPLPPASFYLIHYGLLRGWKEELPAYGFKFVVFDEIQELRRSESEKYSAASLLAESTENRIGLSGTPIYNKGGEIWNVMNILDMHCLGDWDAFTREWCYGYGSDVVADPELLGDYLKREGLMLRRTKEQVLNELPPKRRIVQQVDMNESLFNKFMKNVHENLKRYDETTDWKEKWSLKSRIGEETRRATGVAKAKDVADFVRILLEAGEAVVLYGYHHDVYEIWMNELRNYHPVKITGQESPKEKDEAKRKFIEAETNLIIISLRSSAGIDGLQHRANINVFGELDWSPGIHSQCEDRTHRMGQKDSVISYYLVCSEGTDEQMMDALGFKTSQFVGIMGDKSEGEENRSLSQVVVGKHLDDVINRLRRGKAS